jgi:hypothetical protein
MTVKFKMAAYSLLLILCNLTVNHFLFENCEIRAGTLQMLKTENLLSSKIVENLWLQIETINRL